MGKANKNAVRYLLVILLIILAVNAFFGGYYGIAGAEGVPTEWLDGSPFPNYFIPSLFLMLFIGGSAVVAAFSVWRNLRMARIFSLTCGIITLVWIIVQIVVIGYVSWMQPVTALAGALIVFLAALLPRTNHLDNETNIY